MPQTDGGARKQLVEHLTDVHKMVRRGAEASGRQADSPALRTCPEAEATADHMRQSLKDHARAVERRLLALGCAADGTTDGVVGPPEGVGRPTEALDGDHEFLQRLSLAYLRLRSAAQLEEDHETTELADRGYADTQYLIRERISRAKPRAAAIDLSAPTSKTPGTVPDSGRSL